MRNLLAVAGLAIKEGIRRKIFLLALVFLLSIFVSVLFLPSFEPATKIKFCQIWMFRLLIIFSAIACIFIAGTSIPRDIEDRTIYTIASKPLSKGTLFLGKLAGYTVLIFVFIILCALIGVLFLRVVYITTGSPTALLNFPEVKPSRLDLYYGARETEEDKKIQYADLFENIQDVNTEYGLITERSTAVYTFENLNTNAFNDPVEAEIEFECQGAMLLYVVLTATVKIRVDNPKTNQSFEKTVKINSNYRKRIELCPKKMLEGGTIKVTLSKEEKDRVVIFKRNQFVLIKKPVIFESALLKGIFMLFFMCLLILSATMGLSCIVSTPVVIFFGVFLFLVGSAFPFVVESAKTAEQSIKAAEEARLKGTYHRHEEELPPWLVKVSLVIGKISFHFLPDFSNYDFFTPMLDAKTIPLNNFFNSLVYTLIRILFIIPAGCILIILRDFQQ